MSLKTEVLSAGAVALSTSAILAELVSHLIRKGVLRDAEVREIYESALMALEYGQGDEENPAFIAARELIEMHLRPKE
ncbi:hypothetical protein [Neorhizobium sp. LjRoot104]|uniref:hypothetical protein n=1 Tax=Neorhizobium sp. LjRoot104 TaxID=3342254 RepID=UPI003ECFA36F